MKLYEHYTLLSSLPEFVARRIISLGLHTWVPVSPVGTELGEGYVLQITPNEWKALNARGASALHDQSLWGIPLETTGAHYSSYVMLVVSDATLQSVPLPSWYRYPNAGGQGAVDHPKHYNTHPSGVECIQVVEHMGFNLGNAVKYIWRAGEKGAAIEDLKKAEWYIRREINRRELEGNTNE